MAVPPRPVVRSIEDRFGERCVDLIRHFGGRVTFKEFRRDVEDGGRWTLVGDFSGESFATIDEALGSAVLRVAWLGDVVGPARSRSDLP